MKREHAATICDLIESATGNWPVAREAMLKDYDWEPTEIVAAIKALCKEAGRTPLLEINDF